MLDQVRRHVGLTRKTLHGSIIARRGDPAAALPANMLPIEVSADIQISEPPPPHETLRKLLKVAMLAISVLWIYEQYLEHIFEARNAQAERDLNAAAERLGSTSLGVQSSGVRSLFEVAFRELPAETNSNWYGPPVNLVRWIFGKRELRFLSRARDLFSEFAKSPRLTVVGSRDQVSTMIAKTAAEWITKESHLLGKSVRDPSLWLVYQADLRKAYAPSSNFAEQTLYDVDFSSSILDNSNFSGADMQESKLENASLRSGKLSQVNLIKADLSHSKLNFSNLTSARLEQADLSGADLSLAICDNADFSAVTANTASFHTASLHRSVFMGAKLRDVDFSQADIREVDFGGADLTNADFRFAIGIADVKSWKNAITTGTLFPPSFRPPETGGPP